MLEQFNKDLAIGKRAEDIVLHTFAALSDDYAFEDVSGEKEFYYRGDIRATDKFGREIFIEVKNDSRIHTTGNILCEEEVYYKSHGGYYGKGNMSANYDIYCVVSEKGRKIYVLDFDILKENYTKGEFKVIEHPSQTTYCYLLDIDLIAAMGRINYSSKLLKKENVYEYLAITRFKRYE